jgi:hypothetical protein
MTIKAEHGTRSKEHRFRQRAPSRVPGVWSHESRRCTNVATLIVHTSSVTNG